MSNNESVAERKALNLMGKENFQGISKSNVMQMFSILDKIDPEVAKELIAQIPEAVGGFVEDVKQYTGLLTKGIDSCNESTASCFQTEDEIINSLKAEMDKEGTTFEQKQYYIDKINEAAERKEAKDTEHKEQISMHLRHGKEVTVFCMVVIAGLFLNKAEIKLPKLMRN